tara:strand:+ start:172 stop:612 length:441 start_codon:yes stop_codon:yes gene_type:complete
MYFIYKIIVNDKNYIGSTNNIRTRLLQHKYNLTKKDNSKYNLPFYKYIRNNKLTIEECKLEIVKILWDCNSMNNAKIEEQKCIEELKPELNTHSAYQPYLNKKEYDKIRYYKINSKVKCECGRMVIERELENHKKRNIHINLMNKQ